MGIELLEGDGRDMLVTDLKPATIYTCVEDAHGYVESLFYNTLAFLQSTEQFPPKSFEQLSAVVKRHRELCSALDSSFKALDNFEASQMEEKKNDRAIAILKVYHIMLSIRLQIDILRPSQREDSFDNLEGYLQQMLEMCELIADGNCEEQNELQTCTSGLGTVMPLHTIVARCRNPELRRRALRLLLTSGRQEGLWNARLTGKIASYSMAIEEATPVDMILSTDRISSTKVIDSHNRVRELRISFNGERKASVEFVTVEDWTKGQEGMKKVVEW
jgi:hypothetical protein